MAVEDWCHSSNTVIATMGKSMKPKYDKYWEKSNMALSVACFLDPRFKTNLVNYYAEKIYGEIDMFQCILKKKFHGCCQPLIPSLSLVQQLQRMHQLQMCKRIL